MDRAVNSVTPQSTEKRSDDSEEGVD